MSDLVIVVIPYYAPGAQGNELALAIKGWKIFFSHSNFKIVLVGEGLPHAYDNDPQVVCIESKRVEARKGSYRQHLDYVSCFRKVYERFGKETDGMIMVGDDCYAVNSFDLAAVQVLKMHNTEFFGDPSSTNGWRRDVAKTRQLLDKEGYEHRNFTTHLPQWYEWQKLLATWDLYSMDTESYVIEDLYYNMWYGTHKPILLNRDDNFRLGVWSQDVTPEDMYRALRDKIWITNSVAGWSRTLEDVLNAHYGPFLSLLQ